MQEQFVIYDRAGTQRRFPDAAPMRASIRQEAKLMTHPLEDGSMVVDHRVIQPYEAQVILYATGEKYRAAYGQIKSSYLAGELLVLQTRTDTLTSMVISAMPSEETGDMADGVQIVLRMIEAKFFKSRAGSIRPKAGNGKSNSTQKRGEQTAKKSSVLHDVFY